MIARRRRSSASTNSRWALASTARRRVRSGVIVGMRRMVSHKMTACQDGSLVLRELPGWRLASSTATLLTVARGDTQRDFAAAAAEDGIVLERQSLPWLCERGHLVLPNVAAEARVLLERIYIA